jgi:hypothetical protein
MCWQWRKSTSSRSTIRNFPLSSENMEEKPPSDASALRSLAEIDFPAGEGPKPHAARFLDPRVVEKHFAPLMKNPPSPEERWARKTGAAPFPGI